MGLCKRTSAGGRTGPPQKLSKMLCDGRISRVIQSNLHQRGAALAFRHSVGRNHREEAIEEQRAHFVAGDLAAKRAADQAGAAAQDRKRPLVGSFGAHEHFLGCAALLPQGMKLHGVESCSLSRKTALRRCRATARSMLSPPSSRWSPTATRSSCSSPALSVTAMSVKSVVPPPMSTTRIRSPGFTCSRQFGLRSIQA